MKAPGTQGSRALLRPLYRSAKTKITSLWQSILGSANSGRRLHDILASLMVVVATLGAIVSGMAAVAENEAERVSRQLTQGHHLGLTYRQELLTDGAMRDPLKERSDACINLGEQYLQAVNRNILNKPGMAAQLDLHAQEEFAAARALWPFLYILRHPFDRELSPEQSLQKRVAFFLAQQGFEATWKDPENDDDSSKLIWEHLDQKFKSAHHMTHHLSLGVVLFVAALVIFTISDMRRQIRWKRRLLYLGVLVAGSALVYTLVSIQVKSFFSSGNLILAGLLIFALVDLLKAIGSPSPGKEPEGEEEGGYLEPELPEVKDCYPGGALYMREMTKGISRWLVMLIVITVFCTALCGYWYSLAASRAAEAAHAAIEDLIEMNCRSSRLNALINRSILRLAQVREYRARYAALGQLESQVQKAPAGFLTAARVRLEAYKHLARLQDQTLLEEPTAGVEADARFPEKIKSWPLQYRAENWWEKFALWDAHSQRSLVWHRQARVFLSILTILAMAIYLFGQAHSLGKRPASRQLMIYGVVLLMIAMGLALETRLGERQTDKEAEEEAAYHYAAAMSKIRTAHTPEEYREVVKDLEAAVKCRPDFALAQVELAGACAKEGSSQIAESFVSLPTKTELSRIIYLKQKALHKLKEYGYTEPARTLMSLGYNSLLLALQNHYLPGVTESIAYSQRAAQKGGEPELTALTKWNLRLAQIAAKGSQHADTEALTAGGSSKNMIISAFTDLEILSKYYGPLHPGEKLDLKGDKERLASLWPGSPSPDPERPWVVPIRDSGQIEVSAHTVRWRGQMPQFDPRRDRLFMVWYVLDEGWDVWRALPEVSGPVYHHQIKRVQVPWLEIEGSFLANTGYTRCLPAGRYRAELYLNGRLTSDPAATMNPPSDLTPVSLYDLNVGLCRPGSWRPIDLPREFKDRGDLLYGFQTGEGNPAAFVFTFYVPRSFARLEIISRVQTRLKQAGIKSPGVFIPYDSREAGDLTAPSAAAFYKHWITGEGVQHVGLVFSGAAPGKELYQTLDSMNNWFGAEAEWDSFPYLDARVVSLRFYESNQESPDATKRIYRKTFQQSETRYIKWELNLDATPSKKIVQFAGNDLWFGPEGNILNNGTKKWTFPPGWQGSGLTDGLGAATPGQWQPGTYTVVLRINGMEMARGSFQVVAAKAQAGRRQK